MKKYIPYIVILLITYLAIAFVKMQFNPQYWTSGERASLILTYIGEMILYPLLKQIAKYMKEDAEM